MAFNPLTPAQEKTILLRVVLLIIGAVVFWGGMACLLQFQETKDETWKKAGVLIGIGGGLCCVAAMAWPSTSLKRTKS